MDSGIQLPEESKPNIFFIHFASFTCPSLQQADPVSQSSLIPLNSPNPLPTVQMFSPKK